MRRNLAERSGCGKDAEWLFLVETLLGRDDQRSSTTSERSCLCERRHSDVLGQRSRGTGRMHVIATAPPVVPRPHAAEHG